MFLRAKVAKLEVCFFFCYSGRNWTLCLKKPKTFVSVLSLQERERVFFYLFFLFKLVLSPNFCFLVTGRELYPLNKM